MKDVLLNLDIQLEHQLQVYELYVRPKLDMLRVLILSNNQKSVQKMVDRYVAHTSCILESCCQILEQVDEAHIQDMMNRYQDLLAKIEMDTVYIDDLTGSSKNNLVSGTSVTLYSLFSSEGYVNSTDMDNHEAEASSSQLN